MRLVTCCLHATCYKPTTIGSRQLLASCTERVNQMNKPFPWFEPRRCVSTSSKPTVVQLSPGDKECWPSVRQLELSISFGRRWNHVEIEGKFLRKVDDCTLEMYEEYLDAVKELQKNHVHSEAQSQAEELVKNVELLPECPRRNRLLSSAYFTLGKSLRIGSEADAERAIKAFDRALSLNPDHAEEALNMKRAVECGC